VLQLADVVKRYRDAIWEKDKIEALLYASSSAVALDAVYKALPLGEFHLPPAHIGELLRGARGLLGGYVSGPARGVTRATCWGNISDVGLMKLVKRITKLDFASLYPTVLLNFRAPARWDPEPMKKEDGGEFLVEILRHDRAWLNDQTHGVLIDATVKYCCDKHQKHTPSCATCADMRERAGNLPACLIKREVEFHEHAVDQQKAEILSSGVLNLEGAAEGLLLENGTGKLYHFRLAFAIAEGADLAAATAEQVRGMIGQYPLNRAAIAEGDDMEMWEAASEVYGLGWVNMAPGAKRPQPYLRCAKEVLQYVQPVVGRLNEMPVLCVQREGSKFVIAAPGVGVAADVVIPESDVPQLLSADPSTLVDGSDAYWDAVGRKVCRFPEDATRGFADKLSAACGYNHTTEDIVSWFEHYTTADVGNKRTPPPGLPPRPPAARVADQVAAAAEGAQLADVAGLTAQFGAAQLDDV
jgi:hypothetical protein